MQDGLCSRVIDAQAWGGLENKKGIYLDDWDSLFYEGNKFGFGFLAHFFVFSDWFLALLNSDFRGIPVDGKWFIFGGSCFSEGGLHE